MKDSLRPFTISFRHVSHGSILEVRKTHWFSRRPSLSKIVRIASNLFGKDLVCSYSVVKGVHAWDGLIPESSWRVLPSSY